jgi:photosystem II stability/assembly factor-like uncharacterized protein
MKNLSPSFRGLLGLVGLGVFVAAVFAPAAQAAPAQMSSRDMMTSWLQEMQQFYDLHPQLKETKGSGWKPYNRAKWFYEQRMLNGEEVPVGARFEICKIKNELERANAPSARSTWFTLGPTNFAGRMLDLEFDPVDPSKLYASGAGGGLWRTTDSGVSWTPLSDETGSLAVNAICVLPSDPNIILIGTGEGTFNIDRINGVGILRSTDGGATWNTTSLTYSANQGHGFHVMEVNPLTGTILAGATDGLWRSSDDGQTWTNVRPEDGGTNYYDVVWRPGSATTVYAVKGEAGSGNGVKISTNDGLTFAAAGPGGPPGFAIGKSKLAISAADPNKLYAHFTDKTTYSTIGTYLSTDNGANWTLRSSVDIVTGQGWYNLIFAADPNNADRLIGGGVPFFRSTNGGTSWSGIGAGVHVDQHAIRWKPGSPDEVWIGNDGGVYQSTNDGSTWIDRNSTLVTYQFYDICVSQFSTNFIMGGTQDNGTDRWTGTTTWLNGLGADGMVCNINPNIGTTVFAEIQFGDHRKSTNSGASFFPINSGIPGGNQQWVVPVAEDQTPGNGDHLYTNHGSGGIYRTTNGGASWQNVSSHTAVWIDISPINGNYVFTTAGGSMTYTTNDGASWTTASSFGFPTGSATKVLASPVDVNTVYLTFSGYGDVAHVARSTDLGSSWTDISGNLPGVPTNAIVVDPLDPNDIYIGTDVGVWRTTDAGVTWGPYEVGFPNTVVVDLELQKTSRKLVAGTHGRGAWEVDITGSETGVEVAAPASLNLMLDPPSPNPVSRETVLRFAAKHSGEITLSIFDVTGRLVSEVVRAPIGDGIIRMAPWHADDVPSGVYFAVLQAGTDRISRKIVVAK